MTDEEARDLTWRVATLLGWEWPEYQVLPIAIEGRRKPLTGWRVVPTYARSWEDMREVVEWIVGHVADLRLIEIDIKANRPTGWKAIVFLWDGPANICGSGADLPEAVCRAAIALSERLAARP